MQKYDPILYDSYVEDYVKSETSLQHYCDDNDIPYMKLYYYIKKNCPHLVTTKSNGKSVKSRKYQKSAIKFDVTKEDLERLFFHDGLGQKEIAEIYNVSKSLVCMKMKDFGIDVRSAGQTRYWTKERRGHFSMLANAGVFGVFRNENWKYHTTSIEVFFMEECDRLNISYKRQYPIERYGHQYDFYIEKYNLLVEMDGEYFHNMPHQQIKDMEQMRRSNELGYNIVRITDKQIKKNKKIVEEVFSGFEKFYG